jgi:hypothetical protein
VAAVVAAVAAVAIAAVTAVATAVVVVAVAAEVTVAAVVASTLRGRPERIFISVDESTGRSTTSFQPTDIGTPIVHEDDHKGVRALADAKAIVDKNPGCTVHGPHFHAARPPGKSRFRKRPGPGA